MRRSSEVTAENAAVRIRPILQIDSSINSSLGQILRFSNDRVRAQAVCGAAAGSLSYTAATFDRDPLATSRVIKAPYYHPPHTL